MRKIYEKVPMPLKKIIVVSANDYVYHVVRTFRNENGNPDNERILIGKKEDNMLRPNRNYFEIYNKKEVEEKTNENDEIRLGQVVSVGEFIVLDKISNDLKLKKILKNIFPTLYNHILSIAFFMISFKSASMYIEDFQENNYTYMNKKITSQRSSEIYKEIDTKSRLDFFDEWIASNGEDEYIAIDVTSKSSYCTNNEYTDWGYNRDHEKLPQINIATLVGEKSKLPYCYNIYSGSINDKTFLNFMLKNAEDFNLKIGKHIMDKGFYTEENVVLMLENGLQFIACVKENNAVKKILLTNTNELKSAKNYIENLKVYGSSYDFPIKDKIIKIHMFFDNSKIAKEEADLYSLISKYEDELKEIKKIAKEISKKYLRFYDIEVFGDKTFTYKKNYDKIENERKLLGYFACATNIDNITSEETIKTYRAKDIIEKHFDDMKNYNDGNRSRTHITETFEGKSFIEFISLVYKSQMELKLSNYKDENKTCVEKILIELSKLKIIKINDKFRLLQPITKKQREILKCFSINDDDVSNFVAKLNSVC